MKRGIKIYQSWSRKRWQWQNYCSRGIQTLITTLFDIFKKAEHSKVRDVEDIKYAAQIEFLEMKTTMSKMKNNWVRITEGTGYWMWRHSNKSIWKETRETKSRGASVSGPRAPATFRYFKHATEARNSGRQELKSRSRKYIHAYRDVYA